MSADRALASLRGLIRTVEELAYVPRKVAVIAAPKISALIRRQFLNGCDPYGRQWRALRPSTLANGRRPPPLTDTARMRDGTVAKPGRAGITLTVGAPYAKFHQYGFRAGRTSVGPRRILPNAGMPASWRKALDESATLAIRQARR